jgi:hypothetical protein
MEWAFKKDDRRDMGFDRPLTRTDPAFVAKAIISP